jgi:hypothetical protein
MTTRQHLMANGPFRHQGHLMCRSLPQACGLDFGRLRQEMMVAYHDSSGKLEETSSALSLTPQRNVCSSRCTVQDGEMEGVSHGR